MKNLFLAILSLSLATSSFASSKENAEPNADAKYRKMIDEAQKVCAAKFPSLQRAVEEGDPKMTVDPKLATEHLANKDIEQFKGCVMLYFPMQQVKTYPGSVIGAALVLTAFTSGTAALVLTPDISSTALSVVSAIAGGSIAATSAGAAGAISVVYTAHEKELNENARKIFRRVNDTRRIVHQHYEELDEEAAHGSDDAGAGSAQ